MKKMMFIFILSALSSSANAMLKKAEVTHNDGSIWTYYHYYVGQMTHSGSRCIEGSSKGKEQSYSCEYEYYNRQYRQKLLEPQFNFSFNQLEALYNEQEAKKANP